MYIDLYIHAVKEHVFPCKFMLVTLLYRSESVLHESQLMFACAHKGDIYRCAYFGENRVAQLIFFIVIQCFK
jgi:hypothetical protein